MFFKLVLRNSKRARRENGLFHASLLVVVIAFYVILALPKQDAIVFLKSMESDAIRQIFRMIPVLFAASLCILFFLVYFAGRYQMERRKHEFGVYRMMGMSRSRLFFMLLTEDMKSSLGTLVIGIPVAVCISELVSLITAKVEGLGILNHQSTFSLAAVAGTAVGFILVKMFACLFLSGNVVKEEIGDLLYPKAKEEIRRRTGSAGIIAFFVGAAMLCLAFYNGIRGDIWENLLVLARTVLFGIAGMFLVFYGIRFPLEILGKKRGRHEKLGMFTFRQLEEMFIRKSSVPAVSCILVLVSLALFGAGVGVARSYTKQVEKVADYTFAGDYEESGAAIQKLKKAGLRSDFRKLTEIKTGYIDAMFQDGKSQEALKMNHLVASLKKHADTTDLKVFTQMIEEEDAPHLIALSGYNELLRQMKEKPITLKKHQAAVYLGEVIGSDSSKDLMNRVLREQPKITMDGTTYTLTGTVTQKEIVADRAISLGFALIVPDSEFEKLTAGKGTTYLDGTLAPSKVNKKGLIRVYQEMNQKLKEADIPYDCFLQSMGRQMFYGVCTSYITIYMAVILLIIANTVISVQFLTNQQKTGRRYQTLIRLGATHRSLATSAGRQINWYFGIPVVLGTIGSVPAMASIFSLFVINGVGAQKLLLQSSISMIVFLLVIELVYMMAVKRISNRYLLHLMVPEREE